MRFTNRGLIIALWAVSAFLLASSLLTAHAQSDTDARRQAITDLIEKAFNQGDLSLIEKSFADDFVSHPTNSTRADFIDQLRGSRAAMPDYHAQIDHLISIQLNEIMHHPDFQKLEASWRGLKYLLKQSETGTALAHGIANAQERGITFIEAGTEVYEGMIVGENSRTGDMSVNPTKEKKLTNIRTHSHDEALKLTPPPPMTLESAIEAIAADELVEVTPSSIRLRKRLLSLHDRRRERGREADLRRAEGGE